MDEEEIEILRNGMKDTSIWIIFSVITISLFVFYFLYPPINYGGDIVEYFGMTESLIKHAGISLTDLDKDNLKNSLHPGYFSNTDPEQNGGFLYYMTGKDGKEYPVHFFFYSLLALPVRVILKIFEFNELNTLRFTNLILLSIAAFVIVRYFLISFFQRVVFLFLFYLSPFIWFVPWPGPDVYYMSLVLLAVFSLYKRWILFACLLVVFASWHSQPLIILAFAFIAYYIFSQTSFMTFDEKKYVHINPKIIGLSLVLGLIVFLPYVYNYLIFGVFTPWTILQDGWTQLYGFGIQNMSIQKLFEQFFDLNIGLFWYAPLIVLGGFYYLFIQARFDRRGILIFLASLATLFFYQTNPAWHYGTTGYGPTRHVLFILPIFIFYIMRFLQPGIGSFLFLGFFIVSQVGIQYMNGFFAPNFNNTLYHSPYAEYVLTNYPKFYNPTPEIFVDRTNHTDLKYLHTAIYKKNGTCIKAYVLKTDEERFKAECGSIPKQYQQAFDNEYKRKANYRRKIVTTEATLWPDPASCAPDYRPYGERAYRCMHTIDEAMNYTYVRDPKRIFQVDAFDGVWRVEKGNPVTITIPPGYVIDHYSFEGVYVNYK